MAVQHPRTPLWPILVIGLAVVALVAAAVAIAGLPLLPGTTASPAPAPIGETPAGTAAPEEPGESTAWWRVQSQMMGMGEVLLVDVGTLGEGVIATGEVVMPVSRPEASIPLNHFGIGPSNGQVVTIGADGGQVVLTAIDARTGESHEVVRTTDFVADAAFLNGTTVIFVTADPMGGQLTGVWRIDVAQPGEPELIEALVGAEPSVRLAAILGNWYILQVSPTGDVAALQHCQQQSCVIRAVNLADGTRYEQGMEINEQFVGVSGRFAVILPVCDAVVGGGCSGVLLDLETGERMPVAGDGWQFQSQALIDGGNGPLLVTQHSGQTDQMGEQMDAPSFVAIDVDSNVAGPPVEVPLVSMYISPLRAWDMGIELPPGWFLITGTDEPVPVVGAPGNAGMKLYAVNASTGRLIPLPQLEAVPQG